MTDEDLEITKMMMQKEREKLLAETDHWCLSDRTPTEAQLAYRQALRDMPTTISYYPFIDRVYDWPTKPN